MARSKCIAILIASVIGAWGCGGDDNDSGGSAGSGGSGGSVQNACNNDSDQQGTISNPGYPNEFWGCYDTADTDIELSVNACV